MVKIAKPKLYLETTVFNKRCSKMPNISRGLQEIWEVEDRLYQETKGMDLKTYTQFAKKRVERFLQNKGYRIDLTREIKFFKDNKTKIRRFLMKKMKRCLFGVLVFRI